MNNLLPSPLTIRRYANRHNVSLATAKFLLMLTYEQKAR